MKYVSDDLCCIGTIVNCLTTGKLHASIICKSVFSLKGTDKQVSIGKAELAGDLFSDPANRRALIYPTDFVPVKQKTDVLLIGSTPAFNGQLSVGVSVGTMVKRLVALSSGSPVPLMFESAYGGVGYAANPEGTGLKGAALPSLVFPAVSGKTAADILRPACMAPISTDWKVRLKKLGTYRGPYLKERWPWLPKDFDFSYFQAAPEDQQVDGYLRGDERLELTNLLPGKPLYRASLPGARIRSFVQDRTESGESRFREVRMNLDTLWFDVDQQKAVLVWRGLIEVRSIKLREVDYVFVIVEKLTDRSISLAEAQAELQRRLLPGAEAVAPAETPRADPFEKASAELAAAEKELGELGMQMDMQAQQSIGRAREQMVGQGIDPQVLDHPPQQESLADLRELLEARIANTPAESPEQAAKLGKMLEQVKQAGGEFAELDKEVAAMGASFAASFPHPPTLEELKALIATGLAAGVSFDKIDLSGVDFSSGSFTDCTFRKTVLTGCNFQEADLRRSDFSQADLTAADLGMSVLDDAQFTQAKLKQAKFAGASVDHANFSEQDLNGADFSSCHGEGANFYKAKLAEANFAKANLPKADFSECELGAAIFTDAFLKAARFNKAKAVSARMDRADITGLHGTEADFQNVIFRNANAVKATFEKSIVDGADFSGADLSKATFSEASAKRSKFTCCEIVKAVFDDAELESAQFSNANLRKATFDRANLLNTSLRYANLYGCGLWETRFDGTDAGGANLKGTTLARV